MASKITKFIKESFSGYCADGANYTTEFIKVVENVSIRLITFSPAKKSNKPPIVFVPGWVSQISGWLQVLLEMTREYTVYYIETREKISSLVEGDAEYSIEVMGKDVIKVMEHIGIAEKKYYLFGSSLGGTIILDLWRFLETTPLSLILVGPNAEFRVPKSWHYIVTIFYPPLYKLLKPSVKWYLRTFRMNIESDVAQYEKYSEALDSADPWKLKKAVLSVEKYKVWDLLNDINTPTLIFSASKDKLHEPENLQQMAEKMPNATIVDMKTNSGTHSREMVYELNSFLTSLQ
jgi:pimeloyl-ACP methyl ester carboxylesterase